MRSTTFISRLPSAILSATLLLSASQVSAATQVKQVDLDYSANNAKQTVFQVRLINGALTLMNPNVQMNLGRGTTVCEKKHHFVSGELYLGPVYENSGSLNKAQSALSDWTVVVHGSTDGELSEYDPSPLVFDINVNAIKNHYFDPVQLVEAEKAKAMNGGMSEVNFLKQTRLFAAKRTVSLAGKCVHNNNGSAGYEVDRQEVDFMVEYTGSPSVAAVPNQVAQPKKLIAVPLGGNNTIAAPWGISVKDVNLLTPPNYTGQCPKDLPFTAQITAQGKGALQVHMKRNGQSLYTSQRFDFTGGPVNHVINVKAEPLGMPLGETQNLHFELYVKTRGNPNDQWSDWQLVNQRNWAQTCTPKVGRDVAAGGMIKAAPTQAPATPTLKVAPRANEPKPRPATPGNIQLPQAKADDTPVTPSTRKPTPATPTPTLKVAPQQAAPRPATPVPTAGTLKAASTTPSPTLKVAPKEEEPQPTLQLRTQDAEPTPVRAR